MVTVSGTSWLTALLVTTLVLSSGFTGVANPTPTTDGDRLLDSWERCGVAPDGVALPGGDPERKTIYVQVNYAEGVEPLSEREMRVIRENWANMAVDNPDGSTGIDVVIDDSAPYGGPVDRSIVVEGDAGAVANASVDLRKRYYTEDWMGDRRGIYHQVLLVDMRDADVAGMGNAPGMFSIVDGTRTTPYRDRGATHRTWLLTHELLHNVVGHVDEGHHAPDDPAHTEAGWLATGVTASENEYLPHGVAHQIDRDGFADHAAHARLRPVLPVRC